MTTGGALPPPLRVAAHAEDAAPGALDALIAVLDRRPGMFHGCDYESEPLYRRRATAFVDPALRVVLDGDGARVEPLGAAGRVLAGLWSSQLPGRWDGDVYRPELAAGDAGVHPFIGLLRRLAAGFDASKAPGFGFYGAWSFEHWRLRGGSASDAPVRVVLYLPLRVLQCDSGAARWLRFAIDGVPTAEPEANGPLPPHPAQLKPLPAGDDFAPGGYAARLAAAVARCHAGELLSLTMTQAFRRPFAADAAPVFAALRRRYPMPEMFFVNLGGGERLLGASPDLQLRIAEGVVDCAPACGTSRRGADALEDAALGRALLESEKEAAALALCSDAFAERLRSVCAPGTLALVSRQRIHFFATVIHGVDHLRGRLGAGKDAFDALLATAAPPTISGVPEQAALAAIGELEGSAREWFGGAVGHVGFDGRALLGTILRLAWLHDGMVELRTGGVVVSQSTPAAEEDESRLKARTLLELLGVGTRKASASLPPLPPAGEGRGEGVAHAARATIRTRLFTDHDPFRHSLIDALEAAGATVDGSSRDDTAAVHVVASIGATTTQLPAFVDAPTPLLLIGGAAVDFLLALGASVRELSPPRHGHAVTVEPIAGSGLFEGLPAFGAALYADREVDVAELPAACEAAASAGVALMAYRHRTKPVVGLLFRPESLLTGRAGRDALARALSVLATPALRNSP